MNFSCDAIALYKALNQNRLTHSMLAKAGPCVRRELAQLVKTAGGGVNPHAALEAAMAEFVKLRPACEVAHGRS